MMGIVPFGPWSQGLDRPLLLINNHELDGFDEIENPLFRKKAESKNSILSAPTPFAENMHLSSTNMLT